MTPEMLKTELDRAEEAELQSEEQLRQLVGHIEKACTPNPTVDASDCAKTITAALALNDRLRDRTARLRKLVEIADGILVKPSNKGINEGAVFMAAHKILKHVP